mgnify:CR=1 FL=1
MSHTTRLTLPLAALLGALTGCPTVTLPPLQDGDDTGGGSTGGTTGATGATGGEEGIVPAHCDDTTKQTLAILDASCARCHSGAAQPAGSINYITDLDALIREGKVIPGKPEESRIFVRLTSADAPMPPASEAQRPSATDIAVVEQWIAECAGKSSCSDQAFKTTEEMLEAILSDIGKNVPLEELQFTRYFSFVHLYNAGWCDDRIEPYRHALAKLVNSLSSETQIRVPVAIDADRLLFRIDIRDYGWSQALWERIADANPYTIEYVQDTADKIKKDVLTDRFVLAGDAFLAFSSVPPLYHEILAIPNTRQQLEAGFGIDIGANIEEEKINNPDEVARAGFHMSDVSFNHRMIERHKFPDASNRIYWISYDFKGNDGDRNFFADPFDFEEDGGEIIFNLPNGLQGYMLVDALGNRLDTAPPDVVKDKNQEDGIVVNGVSCMGCHSKGMIMVDDDLRYEIDQGGGVGNFDPDEEKEIRNLFPLRSDFQALLNDDTGRFTAAVAAAGVPTDGDKEPILAVFLAFDEDVKLRRAAAELGLKESVFRELIGSLTTNDLDDLRKPDTSIQREVFTANFAQTVCDLKLGVTNKCPSSN